MIRFKQYLKEYAMFSTSDYVFDTNLYGDGNSLNLKIPISGPMFKRIWPDTIRTTVFHVLGVAHLNALKKIEGKKKSISAFFSMMSRNLETGVAGGGGVVAELEADILISAKDDIMSQVDKTGRRWVELNWFENALGNTKSPVVDKVAKDLNKLIVTLVKKHLVNGISEGFIWEESDLMKQARAEDAANAKRAKERLLGKHKDPKLVIKNVGDAFDAWGNMKRHLKAGREGGGNRLRLVIKDYFDGVEKVIKKHKKGLGSIFYGYAKSKRQTDNAYDEQIVNNIKIKKLHYLPKKEEVENEEQQENIDAFVEKYKIPAKAWSYSSELEIYTRQVVAKEIGRKI